MSLGCPAVVRRRSRRRRRNVGREPSMFRRSGIRVGRARSGPGRRTARRRVAVVRELAGDTHPIDVAGAVAAAIEGAIGGFAVRPMRLMSDSVLHFSDNRFAALREIVRADNGLAWRASAARWKMIASQSHPRFRDPHAIRLIRWIRGFIDSAARFRQSITTASRNAVNREPGSAAGRLPGTRGTSKAVGEHSLGDREMFSSTPTVDNAPSRALILTRGRRRSGDRSNHAATAPITPRTRRRSAPAAARARRPRRRA